MKTEELVEFVNNVKKDYKFGTEYLNKKGIEVADYDKLFDFLAIAVVRCVKLEKIWEDFELKYGQYMIPVEGNRTSIKKLMIDIEIDNQYYPKEDIEE